MGKLEYTERELLEVRACRMTVAMMMMMVVVVVVGQEKVSQRTHVGWRKVPPPGNNNYRDLVKDL